MTDDRDPVLQALFADAERTLADAAFTAGVMSRIDRQRRWTQAARVAVGLALALCAWLIAPTLQAFAHLAAHAVTLPLVPLDDPLLAWMLAPVNSVAGAGALGLAGIWRFCRSIFA